MTQLPTNRTAASTIAEHTSDHNILCAQHNELDGHAADTTSVHGITDTSALETTTGSAAKVAAHESDTTVAHAASAVAFTPTGAIAATDVQAALAEVDSEKAATGHAHAGTHVTIVAAGSDLTTARPSGAVVVYWLFDAGTNPGASGENIVNGQAADMFFVAD